MYLHPSRAVNSSASWEIHLLVGEGCPTRVSPWGPQLEGVAVSARRYAVPLLSGGGKLKSLARHSDPSSVESLVEDPKHMTAQGPLGRENPSLEHNRDPRGDWGTVVSTHFLKRHAKVRMHTKEEVILDRLLGCIALYVIHLCYRKYSEYK